MAKIGLPASHTFEKQSTATPPLFPHIGILALPPEPWSHHWTARHQILMRLCKYFRVIWINPSLGLNEAFSFRTRVQGEWPVPPRSTGFTELDSGLTLFNPGRWLPDVWRSHRLSDELLRARLAIANHRLRRMGCTKTILQLWRPENAPALRAFKADMTCYHIDDEYSFSPVELPVSRMESNLIAAVDQVFICSESMYRKKGGLNRSCALLPNGVDYQAFSDFREEPEDLRAIPHPRIGYVGVIKKQIDLPMLAEVSGAMPNRHFVLVGPVGNVEGSEKALSLLRLRPNVHFLGAKAAKDLPGYAQHLDVCLMCYCVDDYTKFISPLKVNEYLAAGKPVVGSCIEPLQPYADVIRIANSRAEWMAWIEASLAPEEDSEKRIANRRRRARGMDWGGIVSRMADILRERLEQVSAVPH